jgi:hypothetical protein
MRWLRGRVSSEYEHLVGDAVAAALGPGAPAMALRPRRMQAREKRRGRRQAGRVEERVGRLSAAAAPLKHARGPAGCRHRAGLSRHVAAMDRGRWAAAGRFSLSAKTSPSQKNVSPPSFSENSKLKCLVPRDPCRFRQNMLNIICSEFHKEHSILRHFLQVRNGF